MSLRRAAVAAAVLTAAAVVLVPSVPSAARTAPDDPVQLTVTNIDPAIPVASKGQTRFTVTLTLHNTSAVSYSMVRILAERGYPLSSQDQLDKALATPAPPTTGNGVPIPATHPSTVDLPPGATVQDVRFVTTTSTSMPTGLCICAQANPNQPLIYPIYVSAHVTGAGGVDQQLGVTATYVPALTAKPAPVDVNWVWPLIDQPHRLNSDTAFTDDTLAQLVSQPDGRLSSALEVVEKLPNTIPLTLVVDPDLLDELQVMSTGNYTVQSGTHQVPGTGRIAAATWLSRLRTVLAVDPLVQLELTPYADPDMESLHRRGLSWSATMPAAMRARVTEALGGHLPATTVAWPAAGALDSQTLQRLAGTGIGTVVLNSSAVTPRTAADAVPAGLARIDTGGRDVAAALVTPAVAKAAANAVSLAAPAGGLQQLLAELAVRAAQEPDVEHVAVIPAPRYVDPNVTAAVTAIKDTSSSTFAKPIALSTAVAGTLMPVGRSKLASVPASATTLPVAPLDAVQLVTDKLPALNSLLDPRHDAAARALLAQLPVAAQRAASSAWRVQTRVGGRFADRLSAQIHAVTSGVQIVRPSSGSYTLASDNSPLPITVQNSLPYSVRVRLSVGTLINTPGFSTRDVGVQTIESNQRRTIKLPTSIQRSGRFQVTAQLLTPDGVALGDSVPLTVHSTALGVVGLVITIVAGVVLALALLVRLGRRWRNRTRRAQPEQRPAPEPVT